VTKNDQNCLFFQIPWSFSGTEIRGKFDVKSGGDIRFVRNNEGHVLTGFSQGEEK
jgi:hypothetical protein